MIYLLKSVCIVIEFISDHNDTDKRSNSEILNITSRESFFNFVKKKRSVTTLIY